MLAPDAFERGKARVAAHRREQSQLPSIRPGAIPCRGDEGARGYFDNPCGQDAQKGRQRRVVPLHRCRRVGSARAQTPTKLPQRGRPCVEACRAQVAGEAGDAPAEDGEPGPQRPSHGTHHRIEQSDQADFIARFGKPSGNLERHKSTEGIAAQVVRTVRLALLDLPQIVGSHRFDARVRGLSAHNPARSNANHRARVGHATRRGQEFDEIAANAVDDEKRRRPSPALRVINGVEPGARRSLNALAKLIESRRLIEQRQ